MSTLEEIEAAIRSLSSEERKKLLNDLPTLLPELNGDAAWEAIIHDPRPRPAFTTFLDEIESEHRRNPEGFREIQEEDFERHS